MLVLVDITEQIAIHVPLVVMGKEAVTTDCLEIIRVFVTVGGKPLPTVIHAPQAFMGRHVRHVNDAISVHVMMGLMVTVRVSVAMGGIVYMVVAMLTIHAIVM